jgi:hypothetical protein
MPVYQCTKETKVNFGLERYNVKEGQLFVINDHNSVKFIESHPNFKEVYDESLLRLAPPFHMIKQPGNPFTMRKEDILKELWGYGIKADPYDFADTLSRQLDLARKMLKRNFITILNEKGHPIFIDRAQLPIPAIDKNEESLPEPDEPEDVEYYAPDEKVNEVTPEFKRITEIKPTKAIEEKDIDLVASIDPIIDERHIPGKDFSQFMVDELEKQTFRAPVEVETKIRESLDAPEIIKEKGIEDDFITSGDFRYLVQMEPRSFTLEPVTPEEAERFRTVKWSKISFDVLERIAELRGIKVEYEESDMKKRWRTVEKLREVYDNEVEKDKMSVEINMLQKRWNDIDKVQPNFRKATEITLKRKITELGKFGISVWYNSDLNIRKFAMKAYAIAKLGLQLPESEEKIDELLRKHKRTSLLK